MTANEEALHRIIQTVEKRMWEYVDRVEGYASKVDDLEKKVDDLLSDKQTRDLDDEHLAEIGDFNGW